MRDTPEDLTLKAVLMGLHTTPVMQREVIFMLMSNEQGRERKYLTRSDFCGKCRPFILKMER